MPLKKVVMLAALSLVGCEAGTAKAPLESPVGDSPELAARLAAPKQEALVVGSGTMLTPRWNARAVGLLDGRVFVAGGLGGQWGNPVQQTEVFNPATNTWVAGPSMAMVSPWLTLARLGDGSVLVLDASSGRLNPSTLKLAAVTPPPFDPSTRNPVVQSLASGEVLVLLSFPGEAWRFTAGALPVTQADGGVSAPTDRWTALGATPFDAPVSAALQADGTVFALGQRAGTAATAVFDPTRSTWTSMPAPNQARNANLFALSGKRVVAVPNESFWGNPRNLEVFTPSGTSGTWSTALTSQRGHVGGAMALLEDGRTLVLAGGLDGTGGNNLGLTSMVEYLDMDRVMASWVTDTLPTAAQLIAPALTSDGRLALVGGSTNSQSGGGSPATGASLLTQPFAGALDANLGVKVCTDFFGSCSSYAPGRGTVGPEVGAPNTLRPNTGPGTYGAACADGNAGSYLSDESIQALRVYAVDSDASNHNFLRGGRIRVLVDVWAWAGYTSDKLDIFVDTAGTGASWTLAGTLTPTKAGLNTLSLVTTLPTLPGGTYAPMAAVRAQFRYVGSATPCTTGPFDDREDVVFYPY